MKNILVEGHRGYCAKYPENTMISFKAAIELGVDAIVEGGQTQNPSTNDFLEAFAKVRGRANAMSRLLSMMEELGDELTSHRVILGHTGADPAIIEELIAMIKERFGADLPILVQVVNPTLGSHSGPDGVAISFHAKHR